MIMPVTPSIRFEFVGYPNEIYGKPRRKGWALLKAVTTPTPDRFFEWRVTGAEFAGGKPITGEALTALSKWLHETQSPEIEKMFVRAAHG